jgi:MFS family permease
VSSVLIPESPPALPRRGGGGALWTLLAGNVLTEIGVGFFFPILPLYLTARGATPALVGAVVASGVLAKVIAQYPGGWLSDRVGRRPVLAGSVGLYALCFLVYPLPLPAAAYLPLRFLQALAIGAYIPAANAMVADLTPAERRGWAFGRMRAAEMIGLLAGPVLGGLVAGLRLDAVFYASAALGTLATIMLARLPRATETALTAVDAEPPIPMRLVARRLLGVSLLGGGIYYAIGTYDSIWTLYVTSRGGSPLQVGLSFSVYALPVLIVSAAGGGLVDRAGYRVLAYISVAAYAVFNAVYPLVANVWLLIGLGLVEGAFTALGMPAMTAEVSRAAPPGRQARTQGLYNTVLNVFLFAGSVLSGSLFSASAAYAFGASAAACALGLLLALTIPAARKMPTR